MCRAEAAAAASRADRGPAGGISARPGPVTGARPVIVAAGAGRRTGPVESGGGAVLDLEDGGEWRRGGGRGEEALLGKIGPA